ncbi:hypothetical protein J4434_00230 [Candidatus Woesearchaeota archaeon]|nr:hypothetical protein [Candidatus Woesearchaeota archaeon]
MNKPESLIRNFSWKFYVGIVLIIVSFTAGGIIKILLLLYLNNQMIWWALLVSYFLTWLILIWGLWWVGKEYADKINRYLSYRFYHESLRDGTRKVAVHARDQTNLFASKAKDRTKSMTLTAYDATKNIQNKAIARSFKIGEQVKSGWSKVRLRRRKP